MPSSKPATKYDTSVHVAHKDASASVCGPDGPRSTRTSTRTPHVDQERPPSSCSSHRKPLIHARDQRPAAMSDWPGSGTPSRGTIGLRWTRSLAGSVVLPQPSLSAAPFTSRTHLTPDPDPHGDGQDVEGNEFDLD